MTARALLVAILLATLASAVRADEESPVLPAGVHALHSPYGVECDPNQFAPLKPAIGDARVVALGEAVHGSRTIFEAKACAIRFLVEEMGFRVVAFEGSVDDLFHAEDLDLAFARSRGNIYAVGAVRALFAWIHAENESGADLALESIDVSASRWAIESVTSFVATHDPRYLDAVVAAYEGILASDAARWVEEADAWLREARDVLAYLEANEARYREGASRRRVGRAVHDARTLVHALDHFVARGGRRDERMADNLLWLLDHHPGERVVLWAHNDHVREARHLRPDLTTEMGQYLTEALGEDYVSIAFTFGVGTYTATPTAVTRDDRWPGLETYETEPPMTGTIEARLQELDWPDVLILLDEPLPETRDLLGLLDPPQAMRSIGYRASRNAYDFYDLPEAFDALVYLEHSRPSVPVAAP